MENRLNVYVYTKNDEQSLMKKKTVEQALTSEGFTTLPTADDANIIMSIGSDGTFLQAVRKTHFRQDCLYAGIAVAGKQSMYCDFEYDNLSAMVETIRNAEIEVRRYPVIEVAIDEYKPFYCLNEFTIRSNIIRTFVLDIEVDGKKLETFLGDGLIISTPTGSTAYNKSMGGAIVDPLLKCFQVTELASVNNNAYRTLGTPFILSGERSLTLRVPETDNVFPVIAADNEALPVRKVEQVDIALSDKMIKTVKLKNNSFWEKVQRIFL
ncbi:MAG TPA: NAD kinase [Sporosarcina sp.]|nr:NAD kinase [Sporosarcina sp.]